MGSTREKADHRGETAVIRIVTKHEIWIGAKNDLRGGETLRAIGPTWPGDVVRRKLMRR